MNSVYLSGGKFYACGINITQPFRFVDKNLSLSIEAAFHET